MSAPPVLPPVPLYSPPTLVQLHLEELEKDKIPSVLVPLVSFGRQIVLLRCVPKTNDAPATLRLVFLASLHQDCRQGFPLHLEALGRGEGMGGRGDNGTVSASVASRDAHEQSPSHPQASQECRSKAVRFRQWGILLSSVQGKWERTAAVSGMPTQSLEAAPRGTQHAASSLSSSEHHIAFASSRQGATGCKAGVGHYAPHSLRSGSARWR